MMTKNMRSSMSPTLRVSLRAASMKMMVKVVLLKAQTAGPGVGPQHHHSLGKGGAAALHALALAAARETAARAAVQAAARAAARAAEQAAEPGHAATQRASRLLLACQARALRVQLQAMGKGVAGEI